MELYQLGDWLIAIALLVAIPVFLVRRSFSDHDDDDWLSRLGAWVLARVRQAPEPDDSAGDMYHALRREKLRYDIQRLRRILAMDVCMSATRQLGNRLAYDWLMREWDRTRNFADPFMDARSLESWYASANPVARPAPVFDPRRAGNVEVLDIRWGR
jgi:hypothetical protein